MPYDIAPRRAVDAKPNWVRLSRRVRPAASLFCVPYAGGNEGVFRRWLPYLPDHVEVFGLGRPGLGSRVLEAPLRDFEALIQDAATELLRQAGSIYFLFGHSLGALIAFEIARTIEMFGAPLPTRLIVSGAQAPPNRKTQQESTHQLPMQDFLQRIRELKGTPPEVVEDPKLIELLLPGLRTDFRFVEEYVYNPGPPISVPIDVIGGAQDGDLSPEDLNGWAALTRNACSVSVMEGGHFFLHENCEGLFDLLRARLSGKPLAVRR